MFETTLHELNYAFAARLQQGVFLCDASVIL